MVLHGTLFLFRWRPSTRTLVMYALSSGRQYEKEIEMDGSILGGCLCGGVRYAYAGEVGPGAAREKLPAFERSRV
jgi:hypothetical protein